ncbi:MAG: hypothetical protein ABI318_05340, partial [Chthoniobacteraceae bacterium]
GAPQPQVWRILVKDPAARGGAREFSVQGTRLTGEQAARASGTPMNMNQLNLDSDGVHTVAEREAKKVAFSYDHASYTLRAGSKGGSPMWEIRLTDDQSGDSAMLNSAATTGNILSTEGLVRHSRSVAVAPVPVPVPVPAPVPRYVAEPDERPIKPAPRGLVPAVQRAGDHVNDFLERAGNHFREGGHQIGDAFHFFFTGEHLDSSEPRRSPRPRATPLPPRPGDEDFVKPSRVRD